MSSTSGAGSDYSLHDVLLRDLGCDLPIQCEGEGWGTRQNPVMLSVDGPTMATHAAYRTVLCMQRGLHEATKALEIGFDGSMPVGVMWRPRGNIFEFDADVGLFRFSSVPRWPQSAR